MLFATKCTPNIVELLKAKRIEIQDYVEIIRQACDFIRAVLFIEDVFSLEKIEGV